METTALILCALALVLAAVALVKLGALGRRLDDVSADLRRTTSNLREEVDQRLTLERRLLARVVAGDALTPQMIEDGQLFRDVDQAEARALLEGGDVCVIDVRTPQETRLGILPGARLVPLDELEARLAELPREGTKLVYCEAGGRSAAACDHLSSLGFEGLLNLNGGFSEWSGPVERPQA